MTTSRPPQYVPKLKFAYIQPTAVQNTWYTVCDLRNVEYLEMDYVIDGAAAEDIEVRFTVEGEAFTGTDAGLAGHTHKTVMFNLQPAGGPPPTWLQITPLASGTFVVGASRKSCKSLKVEIRKTTAAAAQTIAAGVLYGQW